MTVRGRRGRGWDDGGDWIGKSGLERLYDPSLHGQDGGFLIEVDARGRQVRVIRHVLPQAGKDLVLTLDQKVQELAEKFGSVAFRNLPREDRHIERVDAELNRLLDDTQGKDI